MTASIILIPNETPFLSLNLIPAISSRTLRLSLKTKKNLPEIQTPTSPPTPPPNPPPTPPPPHKKITQERTQIIDSIAERSTYCWDK